MAVMEIEVGRFYRVDHSKCPKSTLPTSLHSIRAVFVNEKNKEDITVSFPSKNSLNNFFGGDKLLYRLRQPNLDEKFVMSLTLGKKILTQRIPFEEFAAKRVVKNFWVLCSNDAKNADDDGLKMNWERKSRTKVYTRRKLDHHNNNKNISDNQEVIKCNDEINHPIIEVCDEDDHEGDEKDDEDEEEITEKPRVLRNIKCQSNEVINYSDKKKKKLSKGSSKKFIDPRHRWTVESGVCDVMTGTGGLAGRLISNAALFSCNNWCDVLLSVQGQGLLPHSVVKVETLIHHYLANSMMDVYAETLSPSYSFVCSSNNQKCANDQWKEGTMQLQADNSYNIHPLQLQVYPVRMISRYYGPSDVCFVSKAQESDALYVMRIATQQSTTRTGLGNGKMIGFCPNGSGWIQLLYHDRIEYMNLVDEITVITTRPPENLDDYTGLFFGSPSTGHFTSVLVDITFFNHHDPLLSTQRFNLFLYRGGVWQRLLHTTQVSVTGFPLGMCLEGDTLMLLDADKYMHFVDLGDFEIDTIDVLWSNTGHIISSSLTRSDSTWYVMFITVDGPKSVRIDHHAHRLYPNLDAEFNGRFSHMLIDGRHGLSVIAPFDFLDYNAFMAGYSAGWEELFQVKDGVDSVARDCVEHIHQECRCNFAYYVSIR